MLLTILMMTSILLTTVSAYAVFARSEVKRARAEEFSLKARGAALLAVQTASQWIAEDSNGYDALNEGLYATTPRKQLQMGDLKVDLSITPLDDQLPLAHLFLPDGVTLKNEYTWAWEKMWETLDHPELSPIVLDFMDTDTIPRVGGREEAFYINRPPVDISEWLRIKEITPSLLFGGKEFLLPAERMVTVFSSGHINVNTVKPQVLLLLDKELSAAAVESILTFRKNNPIKNKDEMGKIPGFPVAARSRLENVIGFSSDYFQIDLRVYDLGNQRKYTVIVKRKGKEGCDVVRWEG